MAPAKPCCLTVEHGLPTERADAVVVPASRQRDNDEWFEPPVHENHPGGGFEETILRYLRHGRH